MSSTYSCPHCTLVQSITNQYCEACDKLNPNIFSEEIIQEIGQHNLNNDAINNGIIQCISCGFTNIGYSIRKCQKCKNFLNLYELERHIDSLSDNNQNSTTTHKVISKTEQVEKKSTVDDLKTKKQEKEKEDRLKTLSEEELIILYNQYILLMMNKGKTNSINDKQLRKYATGLFRLCEFKPDYVHEPTRLESCPVCCEDNKLMVTMKICGHQVICQDDFQYYLSVRIQSGDILPWIPCPADDCECPCDVEDMIKYGRISYDDWYCFLTTFMIKILSRNQNFLSCSNCKPGGFLQLGSPRKQLVLCRLCNQVQTVTKADELDASFKEMIKSGQLKHCPKCRHLTFKERGVCNIIECAKCAIWWNWRTSEYGNSQASLKSVARINQTLWEPGELEYQQELEISNPGEFRNLLERNGVKYNPFYVRGDWED